MSRGLVRATGFHQSLGTSEEETEESPAKRGGRSVFVYRLLPWLVEGLSPRCMNSSISDLPQTKHAPVARRTPQVDVKLGTWGGESPVCQELSSAATAVPVFPGTERQRICSTLTAQAMPLTGPSCGALSPHSSN